MIPSRYVDELCADCLLSIRGGWFFPLGADYGELRQATEAGLITADWQTRISTPNIEALLKTHKEEIATGWQERYERLKRIVNFGGNLEFEEVMQVLTLRCMLELTRGWIENNQIRDLAQLDTALRDVLMNNHSHHEDCLRKIDHEFCGKLPAYWWCRSLQERTNEE